MRVRLPAIVLSAVLCGVTAAQTSQPASFSDGQKIEVREGDTWSPATLIKKEGRRYQIRYDDETEEWVTIDRMRVPEVAGDQPQPQIRPATKPVVKPKPPQWAVGQKVEVKWGGSWREASVERKQGEWLLVQYSPGRSREWVEPWRIRKLGSKEDNIPHARPNGIVIRNEAPPNEKPGGPPEETSPWGKPEETGKAYKDDPAYKEADWTGAASPALQGESEKLAPDPAPDAAGKVSTRTIALQGAGNQPFDAPKAVVVPRSTSPVLFVAHLSGPVGRYGDVRIEKIDLVQGKSAGVYNVGPKVMLVSASPDGKSFLLRSDDFGFGKQDRLEVWNIEGNAAKRTLIFYPYAKEDWTGRDVETALYVDPSHVLTVSPRGKLALWDLSGPKVVYAAQVTSRSKPALSAGGKYVAVEVDKSVLVLDPLTGKVLSELPLDGLSGLSYSFSPSGKTLAGAGWRNVVAWDLTTAELTRQFALTVGGSSFALTSDNYGLADGTYLVDLDKRIVLWKYEAGGGAGVVGPSGRYWLAARNDARNGAALASGEIPHAEALAAAKALNADDLLLLKPGAKVSIALNLPVSENERKEIMQSLTQQATRHGFVVADGAPIRIVASTEAGKTIEKEYRSFGTPHWGPTQKVSVTEQKVKLVTESEGKVVWEAQTVSVAGDFLSIKEGQSLQQAVADASKPNVGFLRSVRLPAYLAKPREPLWYGSTPLTAR